MHRAAEGVLRCAASAVGAARSGPSVQLPRHSAFRSSLPSLRPPALRSLHQSAFRAVGGTDKDDKAARSPPQPPPAAEEKPSRATSLFDIDTSTSSLVESAAEAAETDAGAGGGRTGAKGKAQSMSSIERKRRTRSRILLILVAAGLIATGANMGRELDPIEQERFKDNPLKDSFIGRARLRSKATVDDLNAPVYQKLLPDPLPFPYNRPYTLVVDLDGFMVHSEWSRDKGWRTAKRPGLDYFLGYLSQFYEIVLYTSQPLFTASPIVEKLDPDRRFLGYLLFRESCRNHKGKIVKDLDALNRDPAKVIIMDTNPDGFSLHPENGILVKKWNGERDDRELISFLPFLEAIGIYNIPDVRKTIEAYKGTHIPTEHAKRQKEIRALEYEQWLKNQEKRSKGVGALAGLFGSSGRGPPEMNSKEFKTWYDTERERFQQAYLEDEKYWKENGDAIRKAAKEDQERQLKEMKLNAWSFITQGGAPPQQQQQDAQPSA